MKQNFTKLAQSAIEKAVQKATTNGNQYVEPEHLLRAILDERNSSMYSVLSGDERGKLMAQLDKMIGSFPKISSPQMASISQSLYFIIMSAEQLTQKYVGIDHLVIASLQIDRIKNLLPGDIRERLERVGQKTGGDGQNADDVSNKIEQFAVDMVEQARRGDFDPVIGRDEEIRLIMEILCKKTKSNPILVGMPGVGKTALVNGLAQLIANGKAPGLGKAKIYNVDIGSMVAGAGVRGEFEERLKNVVKEAERNSNVILFIDEIHCVLSAGKVDGALDAANMLKPALASGAIRCIGATTFDEYRKYIEKDPAFARRFVQVSVSEPSIEDSITMLRGLRERLETHHGTKISDSALVFAAKSAKKYIPNRRLPDIALDLVDTACASAIISLESEPQEILNVKNKIWSSELEKAALELELQRKKDPSVQQRLDEVTARINNLMKELEPLEIEFKKERAHILESRNLKKKLEECNLKIARAERERDFYTVLDIQNNVIPRIQEKLKEIESSEIITAMHVAEVIGRWTGIPVKRLTLKENERLLEMGTRLKSRIYGQDEAVDAVVESILQSRVGLSAKNRPIGAFLFLGPTGVGKTELAKAVSFELFDDEKSMVFLDMSDYSNEISITKFIGAPAGYIGYNEGGALTEPVKNKPYNVVLLDEVDLAHTKVLNVLYQLMDEGRVVDGKGAVIDFTNTVVIMTSNLGQDILMKGDLSDDDKHTLERMVTDRFGPAFFNRIDSVVYFRPLQPESLRSIMEYQVSLLNKSLAEKNVFFKVSEAAAQHVIEKSYSPFYGARPLKRYVQKVFVGALTRMLLMMGKSDEDKVLVDCYHESEGVEGVRMGDYVYRWNKV